MPRITRIDEDRGARELSVRYAAHAVPLAPIQNGGALSLAPVPGWAMGTFAATF